MVVQESFFYRSLCFSLPSNEELDPKTNKQTPYYGDQIGKRYSVVSSEKPAFKRRARDSR